MTDRNHDDFQDDINANDGFDLNDLESEVQKAQAVEQAAAQAAEENIIEPDTGDANENYEAPLADEAATDESTQKAIDEETVSEAADEMPSANTTGREGGNKKKLQLAAMAVAGSLVALVGVGISVGKYSDAKEAERVAQAEKTAQEQKKIANGETVDIAADQAAMLPPPASMQNGDLVIEERTDVADTTTPAVPASTPNLAYEPAPMPAADPYVPVANSARSSDSWVAGVDYPAPAVIPDMSAPAPAVEADTTVSVPQTIVEYQEPPLKGSTTPVLLDVSAIRRVSASSNADSNGNTGNGESRVGGNLNPTVLASASAQRRGSSNYQLLRGATIPCVLETKIVSTHQGFTTCRISRDVYSSNGKTVVLERGTKVFGEQNVQISQGQSRVAILWTRAETPKGVTINLDSPATGQLGEMGVNAKVKNHFWKRFGGAIMLSMIQDAITIGTSRLEENNESGNNNTTINNTSNTASSMAEEALKGTINIPPTATINQGSIINIMVARDMDFGDVYEVKKRR